MDPEEYRNKIAKQIVNIIENRIKSRQMEAPRAKQIANYIVEALRPDLTVEQMRKVVLKFDKEFTELIPVVLGERIEHEEKIKDVVSKQVTELLKDGKFEEAIVIIKKALKE